MLMEIKQEIRALGWKGNTFKPHKLIAVLTAIKLLEKNNFSDGSVSFNSAFKDTFSDLFYSFSTDPDSSCRAHTPFFHLHTSSFWSLVPLEGKGLDLQATETVGGPGALCDLVDHALISDPLLSFLREESTRKELVEHIISCLREGSDRGGHRVPSFE